MNSIFFLFLQEIMSAEANYSNPLDPLDSSDPSDINLEFLKLTTDSLELNSNDSLKDESENTPEKSGNPSIKSDTENNDCKTTPNQQIGLSLHEAEEISDKNSNKKSLKKNKIKPFKFKKSDFMLQSSLIQIDQKFLDEHIDSHKLYCRKYAKKIQIFGIFSTIQIETLFVLKIQEYMKNFILRKPPINSCSLYCILISIAYPKICHLLKSIKTSSKFPQLLNEHIEKSKSILEAKKEFFSLSYNEYFPIIAMLKYLMFEFLLDNVHNYITEEDLLMNYEEESACENPFLKKGEFILKVTWSNIFNYKNIITKSQLKILCYLLDISIRMWFHNNDTKYILIDSDKKIIGSSKKCYNILQHNITNEYIWLDLDQ
ncbi:hypothetical protein NUSPORA_01987 [Nucleospora cyclopteri]